MYTEEWLAGHLPVEGLGEAFHFHPSLGSTNAAALRLAREGAPHGTLVVADEQTAGRGRRGRAWSTPGGTAIAVTIIIRPEKTRLAQTEMLGALGAVGVAEALQRMGFRSTLKWPNDVLLNRRKVAGILPEAVWEGVHLEHAVLGIGLNVLSASVPKTSLDYPATSLESAGGGELDRGRILIEILAGVGHWLPRLAGRLFLQQWRHRLDFMGERVALIGEGERLEGVLEGVDGEGALLLALDSGEIRSVSAGGFSLRPVDRL